MSLYIDLTEFLANPIKSGIQRIAGEICRHLPSNAAIPVRFHLGDYIAFAPNLIRTIGAYFNKPTGPAAAKIRKLSVVETGLVVDLSENDIVLVPEVFSDRQRIDFFQAMSKEQLRRCRFIVYDLLPLTHPEFFWQGCSLDLYRYYRLLLRANNTGFISEDTRDVYYQRLLRTYNRSGKILWLGCDAFGSRVEQPALNRPLTFSVIGTIEPRKNHTLILEAFEPLLRQIDGLRLCFIGRMGWVNSEFEGKIHSLAADKNSGFQFYSAPSDNAIRNYVEQSRATIYVSSCEGYGLPPVESLWVGTPVIASTTIPSLKNLGSAGIHYVEPLTALSLREAVLAFVDGIYADQKIKETTQLKLPTWHSFTQEVLRWCTSDSESPR